MVQHNLHLIRTKAVVKKIINNIHFRIISTLFSGIRPTKQQNTVEHNTFEKHKY